MDQLFDMILTERSMQGNIDDHGKTITFVNIYFFSLFVTC